MPNISEIFDREYKDKNLLRRLEGRAIAEPKPELDQDYQSAMGIDTRGILGAAVHLEGEDPKGHRINAVTQVTIGFPNGSKATYFNVLAVNPVNGESLIADIKRDGGKLILDDRNNHVVGIVVAGDPGRQTYAAPAWVLAKEFA